MRILSVHGRYAPELLAELQRVVDRCEAHEKITAEDPKEPMRLGFVADERVDLSRTGRIVIVVGDLPEDDKVVALPLGRHLKAS